MNKEESTQAASSSASQQLGEFEAQIDHELKERQQEVLSLARFSADLHSSNDSSLSKARDIVGRLRPAPQFIWRLCNYAIGNGGRINQLSEGSLYGLKSFALQIAKDGLLGSDKPCTTARDVTNQVSGDVIAAATVIHAVARRLQAQDFHPVWKPILDDALLRAQLGYYLGVGHESFGVGRSMLAGFSGRVGLAILLATGKQEQVAEATRQMATGQSIAEFSQELFGTVPVHVAAMVLSAVGCGREAVLGLSAYGMSRAVQLSLSPEARSWLTIFQTVESLRVGQHAEIPEEAWLELNVKDESARAKLLNTADILVKTGHNWSWML